ncbi:MAG: leucine-rich repeat protein, partial [Muribaculaceae bacterium]|nr:leucine-rich repeat protein [Muribaculaceae bacterium]
LKIIGSDAFHRTGLMGDLTIPEGVERIGENINSDGDMSVGDYSNGYSGAFSYCENLMGTLSLPSTLTHIEHGAFNNTAFSGMLIMPRALQFIGDYAFCGNPMTGELKIPETVKYLGAGSFCRTGFTGSLDIPVGIQEIKSNTFKGSSFSGTVNLPEGLREIHSHAFDGCGFKGELMLPKSLLFVGEYAFSGTRISSIVFPENLLSIGKGCFMDWAYLNGRITIPGNVNRINEYTFAGDILLSGIELHENITFVGAGAFSGNKNLTEITIMNPTRPLVSIVTEFDCELQEDIVIDPFHDVQLGNVTLKTPDGSWDTYSRAEVWKNFGRHALANGFGCRPYRICALNKTHTESLIVDSKDAWEVSHIPSWCNISADSGDGKTQLTLEVTALAKGKGDRKDYVEFRQKNSESTIRCEIVQMDYNYDEDECITLHKASKGGGIDILFVGDGFDATAIADGDYIDLVKEQCEAFFGIEPYTTYKDYFNVYACISLSQETGVTTTGSRKNTRFSTRFDNGTGNSVRGLSCDDADEVFDYAVSHSPLSTSRMSQSLVVMTLNSDEYGSATILTEEGSAIAIVGRSSDPYPMDTRGMMQHEACGHAFGKLAEERIVENRYVSEPEKYQISQGMMRGWYQNISLTGKLNEVGWADLIFNPRYSNRVDVYEGGYGVTRGVFRAEINSCMNYGVPYFSAPARMDIMRRILDYSGEGFTMDKFYATDSDKWGAVAGTRSIVPDGTEYYIHSGLHNPVKIIKSKKY